MSKRKKKQRRKPAHSASSENADSTNSGVPVGEANELVTTKNGWIAVVLGVVALWLTLTFFNTPIPEFGTNPLSGKPFPRLDSFFSLASQPQIFLDFWTGKNEAGEMPRLGILDRLPIFAMIGFYLFIAHRLGAWALGSLRNFGCRQDAFVCCEWQIFSLGLGLSLISSFVLIYGCCGFLREGLYFKAILIILTFLSMKSAVLAFSKGASESKFGTESKSRWDWWLLLGVPFFLLIVLGGVVPPFEFDVREYHLQIPKEWFQAGKIGFVPHNVYGNMPLGIELHAVAGMMIFGGEFGWLKGAIFGKSISSLFAILTAASLYSLGVRFGSKLAGIVAAVAYISIPWTIKLSISGFNEPGYAFYLTLSFHALLILIQSLRANSSLENSGGKIAPSNTTLFLLMAFFAGSAFATKYPALLTVVVPIYVIGIGSLFLWSKKAQADAERTLFVTVLRYTFCFALAFAIAGGPWLLKNTMSTGNPVYPLANSVFESTTKAEARRAPELVDRWNRAHATPQGGVNGNAFFNGVRRMFMACPWLSPAVVPLMLAGLVVIILRQELRVPVLICGIFVVCYFGVWWGLTHRIDRFFFPVYPVLCLLCGFSVFLCEHKLWKFGVVAFLAACCIPNFMLASSKAVGDVRFFVQLDQLNPANPEGLEYYGLNQLKPIYGYLNERSTGRVLMVGEADVFDADFPVIYNTCFDDCIAERLFKDRTDREIQQLLLQNGISHVVFNWSELNRLRQTYGYTDFDFKATAKSLIEAGVLKEIKGIAGRKKPSIEQLFAVRTEIAK